MSSAASDRPEGTLRKRVDQQMIDSWARLSGDFNPLHVDPVYGRESRFGGTIAHGHMLVAFLCELIVAQAGCNWFSGGSLTNIRFVAPVRPGRDYVVRAEPLTGGGVPSGLLRLRLVDADTGDDCVVAEARLPGHDEGT